MVRIKGGTFRMGSDGVGFDGAEYMGPSHFVKVASFRIDITEVTIAAYRACLDAGACTKPRETRHKPGMWDQGCPWTYDNVDDYPASCVTWSQADSYCRWAEKVLPTEEMWEYAARGKVGRDFPWGWTVHGNDWGRPDDLEERIYGHDSCRYHGSDPNIWDASCPVGSAPRGATPEGVQDMAGNVAEWTSSIACSYKEPSCAATARTTKGYWNSNAKLNQSVERGAREPDNSDTHVGFRCAQRLEDAKAP